MLFPSPNRWTSDLIGRRGSVPPEHPGHIDTNRADAIVRQWIAPLLSRSEISDVSLA